MRRGGDVGAVAAPLRFDPVGLLLDSKGLASDFEELFAKGCGHGLYAV